MNLKPKIEPEDLHRADAEFLRSVLSASADCIKVLDLDGKLRFMNQGALRLMEVDDFEALRGRPWTELWLGEAHEQAKAAIETAKGGEAARFRGSADTMSGTSKYWDVQITPMFDAKGRAERLLVVSRDITKASAATDALRASEERNRQILNSAIHYAIIATDLDGRVTGWNEGARRILGWTENEMLGHSAERFFTPEDVARGQVAEEMRGALETGRGVDERWHQRRSGERFWADGEMTLLRDEAGAAVGFVKVLRDRTNQRAAEQALKQSEARFRALTAAASDALFSLSPDWRELRELNGGGFLPDTRSVKRRWLGEYVHPDDQSRVRAAIAQAIRSKSLYDVEHRVPLADGGVGWTHSRVVPLLDDDGEVVE